MTQRHKHADVIIAWANGAEIERRDTTTENWRPARTPPGWYEDCEYRVKPVKKYRVALIKGADHYTTTADTETDASFISCSAGFVRWLTDWVEYEE